jgi:hypothetical protein
VDALARIHERLHGGRITHAEVRLIDDQGKHHTYVFLTEAREGHPPPDPVDGVR